MLDGYTAAGKPDTRPSEGDFSLCLYCSEINIFDNNLKLRKLTVLDDFSNMSLLELSRAQKIVKAFRKLKD